LKATLVKGWGLVSVFRPPTLRYRPLQESFDFRFFVFVIERYRSVGLEKAPRSAKHTRVSHHLHDFLVIAEEI
jgi:hypothetical protein